ncbi:hypothetical protein [Halobaculum lipolyticum]|uniref:Uncharacterized protein n=1 Tax=Halobaculum lipolyticum TaxID=3032001 RepID=A0ABD5WAD3_9EURY|nr:hypothetical protein [Halobaculum sp. DT31]
MRPPDADRTTDHAPPSARRGRDTPRRLAREACDTERDRSRRRRAGASAPFGPLVLAGVAVAVLVAVVARAVAVAAGGVGAGTDPSTLGALGLAESVRTVATTAALVARLSGAVALAGGGYCVVRGCVWLPLRLRDGGGADGAGRGSGGRSDPDSR